MQDEPPSWDDSDDAGLESVSEPDPDLDEDPDLSLDPDMDELGDHVGTTRFFPDFEEEDGNMSPITISAREVPRRLGHMSPPSPPIQPDLHTVELGSENNAETPVHDVARSAGPVEDEEWESGSGKFERLDRLDRESTPSSQPVIVEKPSEPDLTTPSHVDAASTNARPPMSSLTRSETESWIHAGKEEDLDPEGLKSAESASHTPPSPEAFHPTDPMAVRSAEIKKSPSTPPTTTIPLPIGLNASGDMGTGTSAGRGGTMDAIQRSRSQED